METSLSHRAAAPAAPVGRLMRMKDVERETSLHRATIYRHIAEGTFPSPIRLSAQRVAWSEADIEHWKQERIAAVHG